jgi:hypothetical protein
MDIDIFISYTHRDNKSLNKKQKEGEGWISRFHHCLDIRLGELLGRDPIIWRDVKLEGNDKFDEEITANLRKAKVILIVISPGYLKSQWCMKELCEFLKAAESSSELNVENKSRIFKIVKTYVPIGEQPGEIRGLLGYNFFQLDEKDHPHEFIPEEGSPDYYKFKEKLDDLAWEIHKFLKVINKKIETSSPGKTVYLAETTYDLQEERENIQRSLKQQGYTILPDRQLPLFLKDGNFRDSVHEYLKRCKLSIHLIGKMYGVVAEGEERSVIDIQDELAMELCKKNQLKQLIWIPRGLEKSKKDGRQETYINDLQCDTSRDRGTDILKTTLEDFKTVIYDTLKKINAPVPKEVCPNGLPRVYLVCDEKDLKEVKPLDDCLYNGGFEVIKPFFKGKVSERMKIHKDHLSLCDAMMIYYNSANKYWLETKLNDLRKAPGYRGKNPLKASAVFVTGERTEDKEEFRTHEAEVIKEYRPHFCDVLLPFVSRIKE